MYPSRPAPISGHSLDASCEYFGKISCSATVFILLLDRDKKPLLDHLPGNFRNLPLRSHICHSSLSPKGVTGYLLPVAVDSYRKVRQAKRRAVVFEGAS
jgi:hypothetical protein